MAGSIRESFLIATTVTATETLRSTIFPSQTPTPLIVSLSTSFPVYATPTPLPVAFRPEYELLRDGSLITPLFINDFVCDKTRLVLLGVFSILFTRNLFIALDYTLRVKIKHKMLFHFLICSQLCALPTMGALLMPFFVERARCDISISVAAIFVSLSISFLIPGILGYKVYCFLGRPRIVPLVLFFTHMSSLVLFLSDLPNLVSTRRLTGSCQTKGDIPRMAASILLVAFEIIFICACFGYAVWRAARYPETRGRTSIRFSLDLTAFNEVKTWDCAGGQPGDLPIRKKGRESRQLTHKKPPPLLRLIMLLFGDSDLIDAPHYVQRKPSTPGLEPILLSSRKRRSWKDFPRILHIPDALKSELTYTAAVAVICALASGLLVAGLFNESMMGGPLAWVGVSWSVTSLLILHNFSRLVRRNERDRILQEPAAWNPMPSQPALAQVHRPPPTLSFIQTPPQSDSGSTINSRPPDAPSEQDRESVRGSGDPFADFEMVKPPSWTQQRTTLSWDSRTRAVSLTPSTPKASKYQ